MSYLLYNLKFVHFDHLTPFCPIPTLSNQLSLLCQFSFLLLDSPHKDTIRHMPLSVFPFSFPKTSFHLLFPSLSPQISDLMVT